MTGRLRLSSYTPSRDFTYVANVVNANLLACECEEAIGQVMNVACGERYSLLELHAELQVALLVQWILGTVHKTL